MMIILFQLKNDRPRIDTARKVADVILNISSATNGKLSQKSYEDLENQTGMELKDISKERASEKDIILKHYFSTKRSDSNCSIPWL